MRVVWWWMGVDGCISGRLEFTRAVMTHTHCTRSMCQAHCAKCFMCSFSPQETFQVGAAIRPHLQIRD